MAPHSEGPGHSHCRAHRLRQDARGLSCGDRCPPAAGRGGEARRRHTDPLRVGRSGHALGLRPQGRLFPTTRDELLECAALVRAVRAGRLDRTVQPVAPLDILAQQIVAECSCEAWDEDALFALCRSATPYAALDRERFEQVLAMLSQAPILAGGRSPLYLHRDRVGGKVRGRRAARLTALTNGGAIPELGDFRVVAEPEGATVGMVNEDWATESMAGDIFLLGSTSWRILRVEPGAVRVEDARGAPPTIPFWLGEAPARTPELSHEVADLRRDVAQAGGDMTSPSVPPLAGEGRSGCQVCST